MIAIHFYDHQLTVSGYYDSPTQFARARILQNSIKGRDLQQMATFYAKRLILNQS